MQGWTATKDHKRFNKGSQGVIIISFGLRITTIYKRKINNDIKAETNKAPSTVSALTRKSRFWHIKIWIFTVGLRKHTMKVWKENVKENVY